MNGASRRMALCPNKVRNRPATTSRRAVGAHAEPHAKLKHARERAEGRHADNQRLEDAELRIRLHDPHNAQYGLRRHEAVGIKRECECVVRPQRSQKSRILPALNAVFTNRRRYVTGMVLFHFAMKVRVRSFLGDDIRIAAVAEEVNMKQVRGLRLNKTIQQWLEIADDLGRTLIADAHQDRRG